MAAPLSTGDVSGGRRSATAERSTARAGAGSAGTARAGAVSTGAGAGSAGADSACTSAFNCGNSSASRSIASSLAMPFLAAVASLPSSAWRTPTSTDAAAACWRASCLRRESTLAAPAQSASSAAMPLAALCN
ncbi:hypothetical protein F3B38_05470 [Janthinobacterium lividum]|nr:hypothetical protein F3B38_05470 [Janthinobacterium lividum]